MVIEQVRTLQGEGQAVVATIERRAKRVRHVSFAETVPPGKTTLTVAEDAETYPRKSMSRKGLNVGWCLRLGQD